MALLFVKDHNIFPNESGYFINAPQGSLLCGGISNLLSCLLKLRTTVDDKNFCVFSRAQSYRVPYYTQLDSEFLAAGWDLLR